MNNIFKPLLFSALWLGASAMSAQDYKIPVLESDEPMSTGTYTPDWESLREYEVPEWFRDAKFGIWAHWGPQCVEGTGDWMARELYFEGSYKYNYHREHYGHPSEFGFKDVLPLFKAENWNPDELVQLYKDCGAQYFFALGNHHDNFDLWDSKYQEWNSEAIGPRKDILDGWSKAAKKAGLPFGISFHADHAWMWYEPSRRFDLKGEKRGVKYDGWLTKEDGYKPNADGSEKWWKGLDPQNLYQQDHDFSDGIFDNGAIHREWGWENGANLPSQKFVTNFYNRTLDAINRYQPDLIYFDVTVLPFYPVSDCGMKIATHMYNNHLAVTSSSKKSAKTKGNVSPAKATRNPGVVFGKILTDEQKEALVWDVERGAPNQIMERPWQCCNCIGDWHYNTDTYRRNHYKSASTVAKLLVDIVSKNGNMLLSVPLRADGTPDEKELAIIKEFGAWMTVNKEGIVATRPWKKFGEGPIADSDVKINAQGFNDGNYTKAGSDEIRFTQSKDGKIVYVADLAWPKDHKVTVRSMAEGSELLPSAIKSVELLGYGKVKYTRTQDALVINLPEQNLNNIMPVLKVVTK